MILILHKDSFLPITSQESKAWWTDFITKYEEFKTLFRCFVSFSKLIQNPPLTNSLIRHIFDQGNCNVFPSAVYWKKEMLIYIYQELQKSNCFESYTSNICIIKWLSNVGVKVCNNSPKTYFTLFLYKGIISRLLWFSFCKSHLNVH